MPPAHAVAAGARGLWVCIVWLQIPLPTAAAVLVLLLLLLYIQELFSHGGGGRCMDNGASMVRCCLLCWQRHHVLAGIAP